MQSFNYLLIAKVVPRKIVADQGTENVNITGSQRFLRQNHSDDSSGYQSFQFGKSITNQRIESFWSQSRRSCTNWQYTITLIICRLNVLDFSFLI